MRWDLKAPCKNCPFRTDETAIRFTGQERAEEIENLAYRDGFPCHLSAENHEDDNGESSGFVFGPETQHCAGAIIMFTRYGADGNVPFQGLDEEKQDSILERLDYTAPVFESPDDFVKANTGR